MSETEPRTQNPELRIEEEVCHKTEALLAVLEGDIRTLQDRLSTLDRLRGLLIKHDEKGLEGLLQQIQSKANAQTAVEAQRQRLRRQLASLLGCPAPELTLSRLATVVPPTLADRIQLTKKTLRNLVERLRREHRNTGLLLADCMRFNRALFRAIFQQGKAQPVLYGAAGTAKPPCRSHLMNVQF